MLRIAICDDCKEDLERVQGFVKEYLDMKGQTADIKTFNHPDPLITECESFRPQVYILDIVMPMVTGIQAAREIRWNQPEAQIIFATSESSFALESFDVNPINYIMKPIDKDKLFATLDLAISRVEIEDKRSITVKVKGGLCTMRIEDIMYIDYRNHVVTYHLISGDCESTPTLRIGFAEYMNENHGGDVFVRCHESIFVNLPAIDKLTKTEITLRNKEIIPVSKSRYPEVADRYMEYRF